jgi:phage terminase Nu1 subunit (DNA packaging protein)
VSDHDAPLVQEYYRRLDQQIEAVEQDLKTGRNIADYTQYRAKVKEREALIRAKGVMTTLINEARKGEVDL